MTRASATWNRALLWAMLVICLAIATTASTQSLSDQTRWWKGNLHTHTFWSDGDDFPEMVAELYKNHGYDFLALSDHNRLSQGQRWMVVTESRKATFDRYVARFGRQWVQTRTNDKGQTLVRLKPLTEFRGLFEEPGRFLLIQSEEITEKAHLNAINVIDVIPPQGGDTITEIMQNDVDAVHAQAERTGQAMLVFINHPNFVWALTAEDIIPVKNARFFEVNNAHGSVNNPGNDLRCSVERMWDIILTQRLSQPDGEIMYGLGTDDAHRYHRFAPKQANPTRSWIMVRAQRLTPESIIQAMNAGDFYSSTGVRLKDITFENDMLTIQIDPDDGVTYTTQFIGTRRGFDATSRPVTDADGKEIRTTRRYSRDIGAVLAEVKGTETRYTLEGDEIYVRAKIVSSRIDTNSDIPGSHESAWVQPVTAK